MTAHTDPLTAAAALAVLLITALVVGGVIAAVPGLNAWLFRFVYGRDE